MVGAEVLTIGTDAWVQVASDDAGAQGEYRARRAWGRAAWANKVAQRVRRAAALTAELAAQSERKVSAVCDHPPGLHDEPAAALSVNTPATGSPFSLTVTATTGSPLPVAQSSLPARRGFVNLAGGFRGARPPASARVREAAALRQRLQDKKEEAWELFLRQQSWRPNERDEFEKEYRSPNARLSVPTKEERSLCKSGWTSCSRTFWRKTKRRIPEKGRRWRPRTLTHEGARHGTNSGSDGFSFLRLREQATELRCQTGRRALLLWPVSRPPPLLAGLPIRGAF